MIANDLDRAGRREPLDNAPTDVFERAFDLSLIGMALIGPSGRFLRVNRSLCATLGYDPAELLTTDFQSLVHPDDVHGALDLATNLLRGHVDAFQIELRLRRCDQTFVWVQLSVAAERGDQSRLCRYVCQIQDVSQRRQAVTELRDARDYAEKLIDTANAMIVGLDGAGRIQVFNRAAEEITGYARAQVAGRTIEMLMSRSEWLEAWESHNQAAERGEAPSHMESLIRTKAGVERHIAWHVSAAGQGDAAAGTILSGVDVTERRYLEQLQHLLAGATALLSKSLPLLQMAERVASLPIPALADWCILYLVNGDGAIERSAIAAADPRIEAILEEICRRYPLEPADQHPVARVLLTGTAEFTPAFDLDKVPRTARDPEYCRLGEALRTTSRMTVPLVCEGRVRGALTLAFAGSGRRHSPRDLTLAEHLAQRIALVVENALLQRELLLQREQLQSLVARLLHSQEEERRRVAYELHDGVAQVVVGAHQQLQAYGGRFRPRRPEAREQLERVQDAVQGSVREIRRVVAGLRPTVLDDFGLSRALRHEIEQLSERGWDTSFDDRLGEVRLPQHVEAALFRVAQEAITNARKHSQSQRLSVLVGRQGRGVRLEVRDWGRGFDRTKLPPSRGPGERVGLTSMEERVTLLEGVLRVQSRPGRGTHVIAEVPLGEDRSPEPV